MSLRRCCLAATIMLGLLMAVNCYGQMVPYQMHLEYVGSPAVDKNGMPIPDNGSEWKELYPNTDTYHTQISYQDNNDQVVSPCDRIRFDIGEVHIQRVLPTYYVYHDTFGEIVIEPEPGDTTFFEVIPDYGHIWDLIGWQDGGETGVIDICDYLVLDPHIAGVPPHQFHVQGVGDNIIIDTLNPVEPGTWGKIKSFFGQFLQ